MPFARGPLLTYVGSGRYITFGPTDYVGSPDEGSDVVHIEPGFSTDLATVPRIFWALIPPQGAYEAAAVIHDALCVRLALAHGLEPATINSRDTDGMFRRIMREEGVGLLTRWAMWTGVRWGALFNPARRAGWWRDAPAVLAITVAGLVATCALIYGLDHAVHALFRVL